MAGRKEHSAEGTTKAPKPWSVKSLVGLDIRVQGWGQAWKETRPGR